MTRQHLEQLFKTNSIARVRLKNVMENFDKIFGVESVVHFLEKFRELIVVESKVFKIITDFGVYQADHMQSNHGKTVDIRFVTIIVYIMFIFF